MIIVNPEKLNKKRLIASRMIRQPLALVAKMGGQVGNLAAKLDSRLSWVLDKGEGIYTK